MEDVARGSENCFYFLFFFSSYCYWSSGFELPSTSHKIEFATGAVDGNFKKEQSLWAAK